MGRTVPSSKIAFLQEHQSFQQFRRALSSRDRLALEDLFTFAAHHLAEASYASHAVPFEIMLLSMLLEEHKEIIHLCELIENRTHTGLLDDNPSN